MDKEKFKKIFTPDQYQVSLFEEKGFIRKTCSKCDHNFWTIDQDRKTCGDTPCEGGYYFIGKKGVDLDFHQMLDRITTFFEKNGHTVVEPYPTVARWRDDLEFTIASIADFQPWVTNGTLPPPANPLVVGQPCIRFGGDFSDVDNVGRTGRHLSSFVMFGQHAFNGKGIEGGYWMDRCIDLNFNFLTDVMKLKPEEITYIEGIWMGGGNFGPNLESFAYGTELVNSVFMQYENLPNGKYREMDLKVIDVGWGLERLSWFSQGTPTIYEATFGPVHEYLLRETGVSYNQELVSNYAKLAGLIDVNEVKDLKSARSSIADQLGLSLEELNKELEEIEAIYAIGDHARTLAFTLSDGAIPSNVGGGYNLRTILRRIFALNEKLGFNLDLTEVIERSALYVSQSYPRVSEAKKFAGTIVDVEKARYVSTIKKGEKYVQKLVKSNKKVTDELLVELYSSRGIPPETVAEIAKKNKIDIDIPLDFYQRVEDLLPKTEIADNEAEIDLHDIKDLSTEQLYYDHKLKKTGNAKIISILDTGHVVLDQTIFYPTGGGQAEDHGWMYFGKRKAEVLDVKKYGTAILHKLSKIPEGSKVGDTIKMEIDVDRRLALMRHHTAVHIVGGAAREVLGSHVWQAGADKTPDRGRLDITHWSSIPRETLDEIEYVANSVVMDNLKVKKHVMERSQAEKKFGFTIYQGGVVPGKDLRIIEIPGIDTEACGGTHADHTGEIGYIRITGSERIQDGIVRITLKAGKNAVNHNQQEYQLLTEAANIFKITPDELPKTSQRFFDEWKSQQKTIQKISQELAEAKVPSLVQSAEKFTTKSGSNIRLVITRLDAKQADLITLANKFSDLSKDDPNLIVVILGEADGRAMVVVSRSQGSNFKLNPIISAIGKLLGGGGGGQGDVVSGGGTNISGLETAYKKASKIVLENL